MMIAVVAFIVITCALLSNAKRPTREADIAVRTYSAIQRVQDRELRMKLIDELVAAEKIEDLNFLFNRTKVILFKQHQHKGVHSC